jgi:hypothetical protein
LDVTDAQKHCFVIGPIGDEGSHERIHADWLYKGIILPVFAQYFPEWTVERADKIPTLGMVNSQIINRLHDAELVIADLSFHNANAFYEMAIRHKVGKPIIHMIRKGEKIPFDVIPHRAIPFAHIHPDDHETAQAALHAAVTEAIKEGFEADNPVKHARGRLEFEEQASPAMKVLADEIVMLRSRIDDVEVCALHARDNAMRALGSPPDSIFPSGIARQLGLVGTHTANQVGPVGPTGVARRWLLRHRGPRAVGADRPSFSPLRYGGPRAYTL